MVPADGLGVGRGLGDAADEVRRPGPVVDVPAVALTTPTEDGVGAVEWGVGLVESEDVRAVVAVGSVIGTGDALLSGAGS
jgi:hypothetical protein